MKNLYKLDNINLNYHLNGNDIKVLKNINLEINKNERVAIIGEWFRKDKSFDANVWLRRTNKRINIF